MTLAAEKEISHIGETHVMENHDRDLVHELNKRLDALWRYDQYIANAEDDRSLQDFWRELKRSDQQAVTRIKDLICGEIKKGCF